MADPFETLGVEPNFGLDMSMLERRHRDLSRALHPDRYAGASSAERRHALGRAIEVNEAFRTLKDPLRRAEALLKHHGVLLEEGKEPPADPEFLMDMMELREHLSELRKSREFAALARVKADVLAREQKASSALSQGFARIVSLDQKELQELHKKLGELRYYRRFLEEAGAIEDELM